MIVCVDCKQIILGEMHETDLGPVHTGICPTLTKQKDLEPFGKRTTVSRAALSLSDKQMDGIQRLAKAIYSLDGELNSSSIIQMWSTEPDDIKAYDKAPTAHVIDQYLRTTAFIGDMAKRGVKLDEMSQQLSTEQIALMELIRNPEGRKLSVILKRAGVTKYKFDGWLKQPLFLKYFQKTIGDDTNTALLLSEVTLSQRAMDGDLNATKFLWEFKDKYNAAKNSNANDAMELVRIILNSVQRNIKDPVIIDAIKKDIDAYKLTIGAS